ncbi:MAG: sigma 54-interacting transcriptional regulator [Deltaproteobacteria bacterium]|nr:sigma 54-interacting transcriptional regulator [Deltaproteobacteria bacterium]
MGGDTTIDAGHTDGDAGPRRAYLVVREGAGTQVIDLDDGADILFGRSPEATVRLEDGKASREHARVLHRAGELKLVDLGGRNGTLLNDEVVRGQTRVLRSGDRVRIGAAEILVAESAGVSSRIGGARLEAELGQLLASAGRAALLRLAVGPEQLGKVSAALADPVLLEIQRDGDYACLLADAGAGPAVLAALQRLLPAARVALVQAPGDGVAAEALWRRAGELLAGPARAPGAAAGVPAAAPAPTAPPGVVVGDPAMVRVFELVRKVAATPTTVLILGETGVGKEVIAEQLHRQSPRASGPFVRLNCGSLPESLLESELFGHEKGAFTGADRRKLGYVEAAAGGTLFLDEIGELTASMQTRLLRVLESHRFMRVGGREEIACDVRVVAATNRDLEAEARAGRFREDLYFRLSAFVLKIPPLRERPAEVELLAELFARQFARRMNVAAPTLGADALALLRRHAWPGNVRELRNAMEYAAVLAERGVLDAACLPDSVRAAADAPAPPAGQMRRQIADLEQKSILDALDAENGNQTRAARRLGISRRALLYKLEKYGIRG